MEPQFLILSFLIDALTKIEQSSPHRFTMTASLMAQLLPTSFFSQTDAGTSLPLGEEGVLTEMKEKADEIIEQLEMCLEEADDDDQARQLCFENASEALLQVFELHILDLLVPEDWQLAWMGVEG